MNELDLKQIIAILLTRINVLEGAIENKYLHSTAYRLSCDDYIGRVLDSIKEGE